MGSENIYLQPILAETMNELDASMSVMPLVSDNIAAMNEQLNETTRILMNLLANQGLTVQQAAYTGASLAALSITGDTASVLQAFISFSEATFVSESGATTWQFSKTATGDVVPFSADMRFDEDLRSTGGKILFTASVTGGAKLPVTKYQILLYNEDGEIFKEVSADFGANTNPFNVEITLSAEECQNTLKRVTISGNYHNNATNAIYFYTPYLVVESKNIKPVNLPGININSANAITYITRAGVQNLYTQNETVFITLPDIQSVAKWNALLLNGSINGVIASLVDNTSHDLLMLLPSATNDISELQQFSNLALCLTFVGDGNAAKTITGVIQRYF